MYEIELVGENVSNDGIELFGTKSFGSNPGRRPPIEKTIRRIGGFERVLNFLFGFFDTGTREGIWGVVGTGRLFR